MAASFDADYASCLDHQGDHYQSPHRGAVGGLRQLDALDLTEVKFWAVQPGGGLSLPKEMFSQVPGIDLSQLPDEVILQYDHPSLPPHGILYAPVEESD